MKTKLIFIICILFLLPFYTFATNNATIDDFSFSKQESAYFKLMQLEEQLNEEVVEPYIDPVWKKIPGYNGRKLNIDETYKKIIKTNKFDEANYVFDYIQPTKKLGDLPNEAIYKGNPKKQQIAFIMNVAWGEDQIPKVLAILKEKNVHITFSFEGKWAKNNPDLVKLIVDAGHEVANHSYSHPDMAQLSYEKQLQQIQQTNDILKAYTNKQPIWFGPPSGSFNKTTLEAAKELDMEVVMWSIDTIDWQDPSRETVLQRVIPKLHNGAIVLMHPKEVTVVVMAELIDKIKEGKYKVTTLGDLLSSNR